MARPLSRILLGLVLLTNLCLQAGFGQPAAELEALRKDIEALKEGQTAIQQELQEIKQLLRARPPVPAETQEIVLSIDDDPFKGDANAKLTLVEFSDYQCPFCARHFRETLPLLDQEYIKPGKVKYVFRDFPIASIHKEAFKAAEAANCAGEQGKYWEMHERLFTNQKALGLEELPRHAEALGLELSAFRRCLEDGRQAAEIRKDLADGMKAGVKGTPTFFLGLTEPTDSKGKALRVIRGAQPYARFKEAIDSLLAPQN